MPSQESRPRETKRAASAPVGNTPLHISGAVGAESPVLRPRPPLTHPACGSSPTAPPSSDPATRFSGHAACVRTDCLSLRTQMVYCACCSVPGFSHFILTHTELSSYFTAIYHSTEQYAVSSPSSIHISMVYLLLIML